MVTFRYVTSLPPVLPPSLLSFLILSSPPSLPPSHSPEDVHILTSAVDNEIVQVRVQLGEGRREGGREGGKVNLGLPLAWSPSFVPWALWWL